MIITDHVVPVRLWAQTALAVSGTLTSPAIDLRRIKSVTALMCQFTSVVGTPQVKVEYAVSDDGVAFGAFTDNAPLVANSSSAFPTPEGLTGVAVSLPLGSFIKLKLTELTGALGDTLVTITLLVREG